MGFKTGKEIRYKNGHWECPCGKKFATASLAQWTHDTFHKSIFEKFVKK